jgi:hypothetical protein
MIPAPFRCPIQSATRLAAVFWPIFEERFECVFLAGQAVDPAQVKMDRTGAEASANHVHLFDLFSHGVTWNEETSYDITHPDFVAACELGKLLARAWWSKLGLDYPGQRFRVYYTERDEPIVRFHCFRRDEPTWLDEATWGAEIARGEVIVLDTSGS